MNHAMNEMRAGLEHLGESLHETLEDLKPKLRGWLHLGIAPHQGLVRGGVLVGLAGNDLGQAEAGGVVHGWAILAEIAPFSARPKGTGISGITGKPFPLPPEPL